MYPSRHKGTVMHRNNDAPPEPVPSLSQALLDLRDVTLRVQADTTRILGILDGIHTAKNSYELAHRLKSLTGRHSFFVKIMRQWTARLQPLQTILESIEE